MFSQTYAVTPEFLAGIVGALISLAVAYVPGLSGWFEKRTDTQKRAIMAASLVVTAGAVFGLACTGLADELRLAATCDRPGGVALFSALFVALTSNQATYLLISSAKKGA